MDTLTDGDMFMAAQAFGYDMRWAQFAKKVRATREQVDRLTLRWTTTRPTEPGQYWWRMRDADTGEIQFQIIVQIEAGGYCRVEGDYVARLGGEWSDRPIPEPVAAPEPTGGEG